MQLKEIVDRNEICQSPLIALREAQTVIRKACGRKKIRVPRIISYNLKIVFLSVIPIYPELSHLGSLACRTSTVIRTNAKEATEKMKNLRSNKLSMKRKFSL